jgi:hypothetical protein
MFIMNKEQLEALEREVKAELETMAKAEGSIHEPITDGVVDENRYLAASPRMLWILKEPWDPIKEGEAGGGWSVTKGLIPRKLTEETIGDSRLYARMAYISYSALNNYPKLEDIPKVSRDPKVGESLRAIAYINVNKAPGKTNSYKPHIERCYRRNKDILKRQIDTINPAIVIAGNILYLFYEALGLKAEDLVSEGSVEWCKKDGRLYINAYHPSYWRIGSAKYVDDLVAVIKNHWQME